jgi:hypothetical protein
LALVLDAQAARADGTPAVERIGVGTRWIDRYYLIDIDVQPGSPQPIQVTLVDAVPLATAAGERAPG